MTMPRVFDDLHLRYGWEHIWLDPNRYVFLKEYVKGPFSTPKLAFPFPYISLCQTEGELLSIRTGIPDCWGDHLIHELLEEYESVHKEDSDIAHKLMKDYHIYLGQGIPNPFITPYATHLNVLSCKGLKENLKKYLSQSFDKNKDRKGNCFCCEKNYLLECPDKTDAKNQSCTCKECHSKDTDTRDQCKCIEILQSWVSDNIHLKERQRKERRKKHGKSPGSSSESSGCETDDEGTNVSSGKSSFCHKNVRLAFASMPGANSKVSRIERKSRREEYAFGNDFLYKDYTENEAEFGFFPYARNNFHRNVRLRFKNGKGVSKEIQTDSHLFGDTKTVQTENVDGKIQAGNKCFRCTVYQYQQSMSKMNSFGKAACISPDVVHNLSCPYNCLGKLFDRKLHGIDSFEKKQKRRENFSEEPHQGNHQRHSKVKDVINAHKTNDGFEISEAQKLENSSNVNKTVGYYQPCLKRFDSLKYLTDSRLKKYLKERETLRRFCDKTGPPLNEATKPSRFVQDEPGQKFENFKAHNEKPKISESPGKDKTRQKYVHRAVMTGPGEGARKKEFITKYSKNFTESDESRTYGLIGSLGNGRKRRKLVRSRKKRTGERKKKEIRIPKQVDKDTQVETGELCRKNDDENGRKFLDNFKFQNMDDSSERDKGTVVEVFKRPLRPERSSEILEKISHCRTRRSPEVMKFIVGDLLIDEKSKT